MKHVEAVGLLKDLLLAQQMLLVAKCNPELLEIAEHSTALWVTRLLSLGHSQIDLAAAGIRVSRKRVAG